MPFKEYEAELQRNLKSGHATEPSYYPALKSLLENIDSSISVLQNPSKIECGLPDFRISRKRSIEFPIGIIEAKAPGEDLPKIERSDQMKRYLAQANVVLTDFLHFRWYTDGKLRKPVPCLFSDLNKFRLVFACAVLYAVRPFQKEGAILPTGDVRTTCDTIHPPMISTHPGAPAATNGFRDSSFAKNKNLPLHRWVPWIAGFSGEFVEDCIRNYLPSRHSNCWVLDPFAGVSWLRCRASAP